MGIVQINIIIPKSKPLQEVGGGGEDDDEGDEEQHDWQETVNISRKPPHMASCLDLLQWSI